MNCCVIVEPPCTTRCSVMSAQSARPIARMSTPRCSKYLRSSTATMACFINGEMSSYSTSTRFSDPRRTARILLPVES